MYDFYLIYLILLVRVQKQITLSVKAKMTTCGNRKTGMKVRSPSLHDKFHIILCDLPYVCANILQVS